MLGKNFITANAVDNILKAPPPPVEGGEYGELAKDYLRKSDYGKGRVLGVSDVVGRESTCVFGEDQSRHQIRVSR